MTVEPTGPETFVEFEDGSGLTWRLIDTDTWVAINLATNQVRPVLDVEEPITNVRRGDRTFDTEVFLDTIREALGTGA